MSTPEDQPSSPEPSPGWGQPQQPAQQPQPTQQWGQPAQDQQPQWGQPQVPQQIPQQPIPQQPPAMPYQGGAYAGTGAVNPFDSRSTPILVTGILSLVVCGLIGIYAWVKGNSLRDEAAAAGWPEPSMAKVGRILGIVGTCLGALQLVIGVFYVVFIVAAIASSSTN